MKLWKEENQVRQARPASDVIAKKLRGGAPGAAVVATPLLKCCLDLVTLLKFVFYLL